METELKITIEGKRCSGKTMLAFAIGEVCEKYGVKALLHVDNEIDEVLPAVKSSYQKTLDRIGKDITVHLYQKSTQKNMNEKGNI